MAFVCILWKNRPCPSCGGQRTITCQKNSDGQTIRKKFECNRSQCRVTGSNRKIGFLKGTFFENCHGDRPKVFLMSFLSLNNMGTIESIAQACSLSLNTVVQWNQWIRDIFVDHYEKQSAKQPRMGGPGTVIQIDETYTVKRKYNRGRVVRKDSMVGGIQNGTRMIFFEVVDKRDAATLEDVIRRHVKPGGILRTDEWKGYSNLDKMGYLHETVDHSANFVNPKTGCHTQRIECLWSQVKLFMRSKKGIKGNLWEDHFAEAMWKFENQENCKLYEFWKAVRQKYPVG